MLTGDYNAEAAMSLLDSMTPFVEVTKAYKARFVAEGFSVQAAEEMAVHFHMAILMRQVSES